MKKRIVILGAGESGAGAAVLAKAKGFDVFVSDFSSIKPKYKDMLDARGIRWEEGRHTEADILNADEIIKSPGIPDKAPIIKKLKEKGTPIISEIEFAGRYTDAKMICITGSNGKTTTTMLTYHILRQAGVDAGLAGNVGNSLALQVAEDPHAVYVIELSSFQLDNMYDFKADIAILLNITPDHLDRYDHRMENYVASKFRITRNLRPEDLFIYNGEDPETLAYLPEFAAGVEASRLAFYAKDLPKGEGNGVHTAVYDAAVGLMRWGTFAFPAAEMRLRGLHNVANVLAAVAACRRAGVPDEAIERTLREFGGVEHRLEPVAVVDGVEYINDSKATNVDSVWYALRRSGSRAGRTRETIMRR